MTLSEIEKTVDHVLAGSPTYDVPRGQILVLLEICKTLREIATDLRHVREKINPPLYL